MITQSEGKVEQSSRLIRTATQQQCACQWEKPDRNLFHWFEICYAARFFYLYFFHLVLNVINKTCVLGISIRTTQMNPSCD